MCVHAFDNGTQWTCTSYVKSHHLVRSLISTLQTRCMLLLAKILLAGWQCTSGCFHPTHLVERRYPTLKLTPRSSGFGDSMTTSQMVIMWPNKDGSVTLSQRKASSRTQPQLDRAPQRTAQTHLAISAVSNCASYVLKNKPFDPWRIYFISALITPAIQNARQLLAFFCWTTIPNWQRQRTLPIESAMAHAVVPSLLPSSGLEQRKPNTHSISHSKIKRKHSLPSRCPQMANSSTTLSGPSLPPDHPHELPTLFSPNMSTKARSPSTLHKRTLRPTRSVTPRLRRLAAAAQYITHRVPRTPPEGQICLPFDYPRFFRINGC